MDVSTQAATTDAGPSMPTSADIGLKKDTLGVLDIAFFIIAAASPLTGVIAIVPIMVGAGAGIGSPAAFLLVSGVLVLFAMGYVAMAQRVSNAGALYTYVTLGLGQSTGLGVAALTVFSYSAIQFGLYGGFGYYVAELIAVSTGAQVPWWLCAFAAAGLCLFLGVRGVHSGAMVLGVSLALECLLLLAISIGILVNSPARISFSLLPFSPASLITPGLGVGLMFACATFIGFEGSAIYSEEARDPKRTIPRATYCSLVFMGVVYSAVTWLVICALGPASVVEAAKREGGNLIFYVSDNVLGHWATRIFNLFIASSIFAALLTFHNNIARYLYSLGRQGLVWSPLGKTLPAAQTPHVACVVQTLSSVAAVLVFALLKLDPYNILFAAMTGVGSIGIILAQTVAAIAIFTFFRRTAVGGAPFQTFLAPLLAILGLAIFLYFALVSVDLLIGMPGLWPKFLASGVFAIFALGVAYGQAVKRTDPVKYARIAKVLLE